tara:strand:+ start:3085 stop:3327 length:243 start_codon:yes stop_codon:yes gene_type:complete
MSSGLCETLRSTNQLLLSPKTENLNPQQHSPLVTMSTRIAFLVALVANTANTLKGRIRAGEKGRIGPYEAKDLRKTHMRK